MAKIRIAQKGWYGGSHAETAEDVAVGIGVLWVEIDGHRLADITSVSFRAARDEITMPILEVDVIGPVEIVYCDKDGNELGPTSEMRPGEQFDATTIRER